MRILVVSNLYPPAVLGGYENECAAVVDRLRAHHQLTVLTSSFGNAPRADGVLRELPFLTPDARGARRAPAASLRAARTMRRLLTERDPDLVYVWNAAAIPWCVVEIALGSGRPVAFRVCEAWFGRLYGGDQFMRYLSPGWSAGERLWAAGARAVNRLPLLRLDPGSQAPAAISWNGQALRQHARCPPAVRPVLERVLHSVAVHGPRFAAAPRVRGDGDRDIPMIAYVGRVTREKGADVAARAIARLRDEYGIRARLVLAGAVEADMRAELERLAGARALEFAGPVGVEWLVDLLASADAMVIPSVEFDAFPQVCLEGALARVPIVASDVGGIPECLHADEHALLHPPGDDAACAAALVRTLHEREATASRVARAYARGQELGLEPYLEASARFVEDARAALAR